MVKSKSASLRWEMNSILMQILRKIFLCVDHQHGRLVTWLQTKNISMLEVLASVSGCTEMARMEMDCNLKN